MRSLAAELGSPLLDVTQHCSSLNIFFLYEIKWPALVLLKKCVGSLWGWTRFRARVCIVWEVGGSVVPFQYVADLLSGEAPCHHQGSCDVVWR